MTSYYADFTFNLAGPAFMLAFAGVFLWAYFSVKKYSHLLLFAITALFFGTAITLQVLYSVAEIDRSPLLTNLLYLAAALVFSTSLLLRQGTRINLAAPLVIFAIFGAQTWYFTEFSPNALARIYVVNFACGLIITITAVYTRPSRDAVVFERALHVALLILGLHFFPRTLLTAGWALDTESAGFLSSSYWIMLQFSLAVLGALVGLAVLLASTNDIIDHLRRSPYVDGLTGLLTLHNFKLALEQTLRLDEEPPNYVVVLDLDNFAAINETLGRQRADAIIVQTAHVLRTTAQRNDIIGRSSGQQFYLATKADSSAAIQLRIKEISEVLAEAIAATQEELPLITLSTGSAEITESSSATTSLSQAKDDLETQKRQKSKRNSCPYKLGQQAELPI